MKSNQSKIQFQSKRLPHNRIAIKCWQVAGYFPVVLQLDCAAARVCEAVERVFNRGHAGAGGSGAPVLSVNGK